MLKNSEFYSLFSHLYISKIKLRYQKELKETIPEQSLLQTNDFTQEFPHKNQIFNILHVSGLPDD